MVARPNAESTAQAHPGFSPASTQRVLATVGEVLGLDTSDGELIRLGENALFRLPAERMVVRIARTMDYWADAEKEVAVGPWLASKEAAWRLVPDEVARTRLDLRPEVAGGSVQAPRGPLAAVRRFR